VVLEYVRILTQHSENRARVTVRRAIRPHMHYIQSSWAERA